MIDCTIARGWLSEYLDGDLDETSVRALLAHLSTCETCPPLADATVGVLAALRSAPLPEGGRWPALVLRTLRSRTGQSKEEE